MNYRSLDPVVPVTVYNEKMQKLYSYKSILKTALYTGFSAQMVTKLVTANHTTPKWCDRLGKYVYLRKTMQNDQFNRNSSPQ